MRLEDSSDEPIGQKEISRHMLQGLKPTTYQTGYPII